MKYQGFLAKFFLAASLIGAPSVALANDSKINTDTETVLQPESSELAKADMVDPPLTVGDVLKLSDKQLQTYMFNQVISLLQNLRSPTDPQTGEPKSKEVFEAHQQYYADLWDAFLNPNKSSNDGNFYSGLLASFFEADSQRPAVEVFQSFIGKVLDVYADRRAKAASVPQPNTP